MVTIDKFSEKPIYEQIYNQFTKLIILDVIKKGDKLASVRELALSLQINPNTIQKSYKMLESKDFIVSIKGKGNYVNDKSKVYEYYKESLESDMITSIREMMKIGIKKESILNLVELVMKEMVDYA